MRRVKALTTILITTLVFTTAVPMSAFAEEGSLAADVSVQEIYSYDDMEGCLDGGDPKLPVEIEKSTEETEEGESVDSALGLPEGTVDEQEGGTLAEQIEEAVPDTANVTETDDTVTVAYPYSTRQLLVDTSQLTESAGAEAAIHDNITDTYVLEYDTEKDTKKAYEKLKKEYGSGNCVLNLPVETCATGTENSSSSHSWGTEAMNMDDLKSNIDGSEADVTVAVIDTGINASHEIFAGRDITATSVGRGTSSTDGNGHGSHVAGIIADGTANNVDIVSIAALDSEGEGDILNVMLGVTMAVEKYDVDVINMSLGGDLIANLSDATDEEQEEAIKAAEEYIDFYDENYLKVAYDANVAVYAASGNGDEDGDALSLLNTYTYPAVSKYTFAVGALTKSGTSYTHASYSNYGDTLDFAAPGTSVKSASNTSNTKYVYMNGTSMATPHMAAAAAWVKSYDSDATVSEVESELKECALDLGDEGWDQYYGNGMPVFGDTDEDTAASQTTSGSTNSSSTKSSETAKTVSTDSYEHRINSITPTNAAANAASASSSLKKVSQSTTLKTSKRTLLVKFSKVSGAKNYRIAYRKAGASKWTYVWTAGKNSYTIKNLTSKSAYEITVAAYGVKNGKWIRSSYSSYSRRYVASTGGKVTGAKKSFTAKLNKVSGATGYQVFYSKKSSMKGASSKTVTGASKTKIKVSKLKKGTWYVRFRPVEKINGKWYYGAYSSVRKVKVK